MQQLETGKSQVAIQPAEESHTRDWHFLGDRKDIPIHKGFGVELPKTQQRNFHSQASCSVLG